MEATAHDGARRGADLSRSRRLLASGKYGNLLRGANQGPTTNGSASATGLTGHRFANDNDSATTRRDVQSDVDDSSVDFSGIKSTIDPALAAVTSALKSTPHAAPVTPLPMVFQSVDPKRLNISPEQQQIIARLQQNFLEMIGGADQDATDPQYLERWQQAQPLINEQLEVQLGQEFFLQYETAAAQSAQGQARGHRRSQ